MIEALLISLQLHLVEIRDSWVRRINVIRLAMIKFFARL